MSSSRTAIIIGGGVIGLSTAYHLARRNYGKVIVLEKGLVGDGSSSRAAGIISGLLWSETGVRARRKALELYAELSRDLTGYQFQNVGCMNFFDKNSWPEREALLPIYQRCGAPYEILSGAEVRRRWPALTPAEDYIALFDPVGGYSEPHEYIPALARRNRELGVDILEQQQVSEFILRQGRVVGVKTSAASFEGDAVISTVYSWTLPLFAKLGWQPPMKTFVHQRYVTRPLPQPVRIPAVNAMPLDGYVRPAHGNRLLLGIETSEREEYPVPSTDWHMSGVSADAKLKDILMDSFVSLTPDLKKTSWETEKVGLLTFSMDKEPILGPVSAFPGLHVAMAFHSGGFAYNPVAGLLAAEYVDTGKPSIDIRAFSPDRFDPAEAKDYLATPAQQKNASHRRH